MAPLLYLLIFVTICGIAIYYLTRPSIRQDASETATATLRTLYWLSDETRGSYHGGFTKMLQDSGAETLTDKLTLFKDYMALVHGVENSEWLEKHINTVK